jgi:chemotaxis protein methyltransferase CheR
MKWDMATQDFLSNEYFKLFSNQIYNNSGIFFSENNRSILESRLKERLRTTGLAELKEYYSLVTKDTEEMKRLLDSVTTNLTRFFRNINHFEIFENHVLPQLLEYKKQKNDYKIRIWSAGCATGEEPYSIAMVVKNWFPPMYKIHIVASDLSLKSLLKANEGFYPKNKIEGVSEKYLKLYFEEKSDGYQVKKEIKELIRFDYHNLKYDGGEQFFDVIFCRNVLIYFDEEAQKAVIHRFWKALNTYSFLFIGHSESLFGMNTPFKFLKTQWGTLYQKNIEGIE